MMVSSQHHLLSSPVVDECGICLLMCDHSANSFSHIYQKTKYSTQNFMTDKFLPLGTNSPKIQTRILFYTTFIIIYSFYKHVLLTLKFHLKNPGGLHGSKFSPTNNGILPPVPGTTTGSIWESGDEDVMVFSNRSHATKYQRILKTDWDTDVLLRLQYKAMMWPALDFKK